MGRRGGGDPGRAGARGRTAAEALGGRREGFGAREGEGARELETGALSRGRERERVRRTGTGKGGLEPRFVGGPKGNLCSISRFLPNSEPWGLRVPNG